MTDQYYTAVTHFNLSWAELARQSGKSFTYSFLSVKTKQQLLDKYDECIAEFKHRFSNQGMKALKSVNPESYSFPCKHFKVWNIPISEEL